jgi:hypothetical protein
VHGAYFGPDNISIVATDLYSPIGVQSQNPYIVLPNGSVCATESQSIKPLDFFYTHHAPKSDYRFRGEKYLIDFSDQRTKNQRSEAGTMNEGNVYNLYQGGMVRQDFRCGSKVKY